MEFDHSQTGEILGAASYSGDEGQPTAPATQAPVSSEQGTQTQQTQEQFFYDATKVPAELQPTFRDMQAAWTKKTQEIADIRRHYEKLSEYSDDPTEVFEFLDTLRTEDGLREFVEAMATQMGITPSEAAEVVEQAQSGQTVAPQTPSNDLNRPLTLAEFKEWEAARQTEQQEREEDAEIARLVEELKIPHDQRYYVFQTAKALPARLGYAERMKRAYEQFQGIISNAAKQLSETQATQQQTTPAPFGGSNGMPGQQSVPPVELKDTRKAASDFLKNYRS